MHAGSNALGRVCILYCLPPPQTNLIALLFILIWFSYIFDCFFYPLHFHIKVPPTTPYKNLTVVNVDKEFGTLVHFEYKNRFHQFAVNRPLIHHSVQIPSVTAESLTTNDNNSNNPYTATTTPPVFFTLKGIIPIITSVKTDEENEDNLFSTTRSETTATRQGVQQSTM